MPRPSRSTTWILVGVAVAAVVVVASLVEVCTPSSPTPPPPAFPVASASLGGTNGSLIPLYGGFLGVNLRADSALSISAGSALNRTRVHLIRWPGGGDGDRLDPLANGGEGAIYHDDGGSTTPGTPLAQFVGWCRSVSCASVITLPAEIDNASTALTIVNYTERSLGFAPTYWEIGNEPSLWLHFGIPWDRWNASQTSTPTPAQFALVVHQYVRAIRSVDPSTGIIGIGGIGAGSAGVSNWFAPTLAMNGPNLSAMAIHVYPAGFGFPLNDLAAWFGSLSGSSGLPSRVESALLEMRSACATCHLQLLVDEFQTGTELTPSSSLSGGYLATYVAAEIAEALPLPIASLDYYNFQSDTPGAWFTSSGASSPSYDLYQTLAVLGGSSAVQENVSSPVPGLFAVELGSAPNALGSLLLVNANASYGFAVNLSDRFPGADNGTAWEFNGSSSGPVLVPVGPAGSRRWLVPPASLALFYGIGGPRPFLSEGSILGARHFPGTAGSTVMHPIDLSGTFSSASVGFSERVVRPVGPGRRRERGLRRTPARLPDRGGRRPRTGTSA